MKKVRYVLLAAVALVFSACNKEEADRKDFNFGLNVRNENYMEEIVLRGVGEARIQSADNLPPWIEGVMLKDEKQEGDPVVAIGVKADIDLEESRTANIVLYMSTGVSVSLELTQWPIVKGGENSGYISKNTQFEQDWSSVETIRLVVSNELENGRPVIKEQVVAMPWAWEKSPICYLPKGDGRDETMEIYKMIQNKADWSLVFNFTGINDLPARNYFGLYNRYTGVLRVFYYLTEDRIPTNNANDHLWAFSLNANLAEHLSAQFAIPRGEKAEGDYLARVALPYLTSPNTDKYNPLSDNTQNVLAEGWWAFDVGMSAYRDNPFFGKPLLNAANIQLCTYSENQVLLNSVIKGNLNGELQGSLNLELLRPTTSNVWAQIGSQLLGGMASAASNTWWLNEVCRGKAMAPGANDQQAHQEQPAPDNILAAPASFSQTKSIAAACASIVVGTALSIAAKFLGSAGSKQVEDSNFGALNANMKLDLNAVMASQGTISSPSTNRIPPVSMSMDCLREKNPDDSYTGLGEGVWNLEKHPVIYVVKDAYWYENKFTVLSSQVEFPVGEGGKNVHDVNSYYLGSTKASRPGLRLITFMDPTSVDGVAFNPKIFNGTFDKLRVYLSYGVYPGSVDGYTEAFRRDAGLDYPRSWPLNFKKDKNGKFLLDSLNLVKAIHTDEIFNWAAAPVGTESIVGARLSSQKLRTDHPTTERRYYGQSVYYSNPYATAFVVDKVQYVYDPQVYLPFDETSHRIYDPIVPDYVVTATVNAYGKDKKDSEDCILTNTLRFLPVVKLISYKEVAGIYEKMKKEKETMSAPIPENTTFVDMQAQVDHVGSIVKALEKLK